MNTMTIKELANNWIENDHTGDYCRPITLDEAEQFIGWMDEDTIDSLDEDITPEKFMEAWNELVTYDDPIEMLMNMTDPGEIRTVEDATKILSEAEANGWNLAPDITPAVLLEIYNDMEPEKED